MQLREGSFHEPRSACPEHPKQRVHRHGFYLRFENCDSQRRLRIERLCVRVAEELSVFCPKTGFPTLPWTPRWWSRSSMPGLRAPILPARAKKSEVAYGEPLNGSPPESPLYALCLAK